MSAGRLTSDDHVSIAAWWHSDWPTDEAEALDTLASTVEAIVAAHVTAALDEAADAILCLCIGDHVSKPCSVCRAAARTCRSKRATT